MVDYCDILIQAIDTIASSNDSVTQQVSTVDETIEPTIKDANPFADILITQNQKATYDSEANTINPGNQILIPTWSLIGIGEKFDLLGVEMVVSTSGTNASNGNYGVEVTIYGDNRKWISSFNSSEMLGNVNSFTKMLQKKIFDVSEISDIAYVEAKVYNNTSGVALKLHSLELVLGQNLNNVGKDSEPLSLSVTSNGRYETSAAGVVLKGEEQTFNVRYVYQQANGKYRSVTIANEADRPENVFLRWYRYGEAIGGDEYGGANWEYLSSYENKFQIIAGMRPGVEEERYKVVALVESEDAQQVSVIESNEVKVTNVKAVSENFISRMELKFLDRSGGTYPYYALDNYIEETYVTKPLENRTVEVNYKLAIEDSDLYANVAKVVWYYTQNVIVDRTPELENWVSERSADGDVNIVTLTKKEGAVSGLEEALKLVYSIPDTRAEMASEGIVKCRIELVDGTFFEASKDIYLTFNGSAGTDYTVIARIYDENYVAQRAYLVDGGNQYLKIRVYDVEGQEITADDKISVSNIAGAAIKDGSTNGNQGFSLNALTLDDICVVKVTCKIAQKDIDRPLNIEELVPIPITASLGYTYLGPSKVMYDSSGGSPQYNKSPLTLRIDETTSSVPYWYLTTSAALQSRGLMPTLSGSDNSIFTPVSNYDPTMGENIIAIRGGDSYTQPLVFYQNRYFSRIINEWDGRLQVNEGGNYVLASAYVAGSKNNENKFTGAILGELGTITDNSTRESGLFGYNKGIQTFGLKTDGSAFFGASNSGRITFNASGEGVIESGGYIPKTESTLGKGTRINLATGSFDFGGGRFVYDGERSLTLTDVTLSWNEIEDIPNLVSKEEYDEFIGEYNNFTDEYQTTIDDIQDQIDTKAQSWYQDSIPTWEAKDNSSHVGDLWHYSGSNNLTNLNNIAFKDGSGATISEIKPHTEWMWKENGGSYYWAEMEVPDEIFDLIDGTSNIFVAKGVTPTVPYNEGDIWIIDWDGTRPTKFPNVAKGTLLTSTTTTGTYDSSHWVEKVKYKDQAALDSLKNEIINTETNSDENTGLVNQLVGEYLGLGGKAFLNGDKIISPYIGGGYLHITNSTSKLSVTIDPQQKDKTSGNWVFRIDDDGTTVMGVDSEGNAQFSGTITTDAGDIGPWVIDNKGLLWTDDQSNSLQDYTNIEPTIHLGTPQRFYPQGFGYPTLGMLKSSYDFYDYIDGVKTNVKASGPQGNLSKINYASIIFKVADSFAIDRFGEIYAKKGLFASWTFENNNLYQSLSTSIIQSGVYGNGSKILLCPQEISLGQYGSDNSSTRQYTSIRSGAIFNVKNNTNNQVADYGIVSSYEDIIFLDYDLSTSEYDSGLTSINCFHNLTNAPARNNTRFTYGYIGRDNNQTSRPYNRGLIEGFSVIPKRDKWTNRYDAKNYYIGQSDNRFEYGYFNNLDATSLTVGGNSGYVFDVSFTIGGKTYTFKKGILTNVS